MLDGDTIFALSTGAKQADVTTPGAHLPPKPSPQACLRAAARPPAARAACPAWPVEQNRGLRRDC